MFVISVNKMIKRLAHLRSILAVLFLSGTLVAQSDLIAKADSLLAEARSLVATNSVDSLNAAIPKLGDAAKIYKSAGTVDKLREADVLNGKVHRILGVVEIGHGHDAEALSYLNRAVGLLSPYGKSLELAFVFHNLGLVHVRQQRLSEAIADYGTSLSNYQAVKNREGEAIIHRNVGLILHSQGKYAEAITNFEASLKIEIAAGNREKQGVLFADLGDSLRGEKRIEEALLKYASALTLY